MARIADRRFARMHLCDKRIWALGLVLGAISCSTPHVRMDEQAAHLGYERTVVRGTEFSHVAYLKGNVDARSTVHVYLEGDGTPWLDHRWVARDPTPRDSLTLRLMRLDPAPSLLLGRPCYHGYSDTQPCSSLAWTHERYSARVVESMAAALRNLLGQGARQRLVLIGYSGGGTLAMLLAERLGPVAVVTIGANLDVDAWARYHDYTPLRGSLDPGRRPPLSAEIFQLHLAGGKDTNVPPDLISPVVTRHPHAEFLVIRDYDHRCCWEKIWSSILARIDGSSS